MSMPRAGRISHIAIDALDPRVAVTSGAARRHHMHKVGKDRHGSRAMERRVHVNIHAADHGADVIQTITDTFGDLRIKEKLKKRRLMFSIMILRMQEHF